MIQSSYNCFIDSTIIISIKSNSILLNELKWIQCNRSTETRKKTEKKIDEKFPFIFERTTTTTLILYSLSLSLSLPESNEFESGWRWRKREKKSIKRWLGKRLEFSHFSNGYIIMRKQKSKKQKYEWINTHNRRWTISIKQHITLSFPFFFLITKWYSSNFFFFFHLIGFYFSSFFFHRKIF